ncbi:hypothetical protein BV22DRAFT_527075 [Leucogyrophana mollusca]|uniref:Uncharacterized protein n=1 Tax=Leucogyrophana mollusca TaxID=85980 RepID=A0ACB8BEV1_9AGAM|nr:hypothetical protein BV22DRAFT_527075 [Leucogyrophana mollusca]
MHRRVVAAVVPQIWRGQKPWNAENALPDEGTTERDVTVLGNRRTLNHNLEVDTNDHSRPSRPLWRRMSSPGASSVLSGSSADEHERLRMSPESMRRNSLLGSVPEEDGPNASVQFPQPDEDNLGNELEDEEWELEQNGLYSGSYSRFVAMYSFVPATVLVAFTLLGLLPGLIWPISGSASHYPPGFPHPLPEIVLSASMFSLAHLLRVPLFSLCSFLLRPAAAALLSTLLHVLLTNLLRLAALALLQVRHTMDHPVPTWQDPAFRTVWWLALNISEVLVALVQAYGQIGLYRDVMVPEGRAHEFLERLKNDNVRMSDVGDSYAFQDSRQVLNETRDVEEDLPAPRPAWRSETVLGSQIDRDFDQLLAFKSREELEEIYGLPVVKIPIFISCLQRFNSIILSLGLTLLLSSSYLRSPLSLPASDYSQTHSTAYSYTPISATLPLVLVVHTSLAMLYTPSVLPRIGVHTAAYVGVLAGLMSFFAGLAAWGALS